MVIKKNAYCAYVMNYFLRDKVLCGIEVMFKRTKIQPHLTPLGFLLLP